MKLKLNEQGNVVVQDGKPVYVHDDGKEVAFDVPSAVFKISALNGEAKGHRERAEAAESKLKAFDGIEDAEGARKALETLKNIDEGKLIQAGKVDEIKAAAAPRSCGQREKGSWRLSAAAQACPNGGGRRVHRVWPVQL